MLNFISIHSIEYTQTKLPGYDDDDDANNVNHNFQTILYHPRNHFRKIILNANGMRQLMNLSTQKWNYIMKILPLCGNEFKFNRFKPIIDNPSIFYRLLYCLFSVTTQRFSDCYFMYNNRETDDAQVINDVHVDVNSKSCCDAKNVIDPDVLLAMKALKRSKNKKN